MPTLIERYNHQATPDLDARIRMALDRVAWAKAASGLTTAAAKAERAYARLVIHDPGKYTIIIRELICANITNLTDTTNDATVETAISTNWERLMGAMDAV